MNAAEAKRYVSNVVARFLRDDAGLPAQWIAGSPFSVADRERIVSAVYCLADELERRAFRKADG